MPEQQLLRADNNYEQLDQFLNNSGQSKLFLVCGNSIKKLGIGKYFDTLESRMGIRVIKFSHFKSNPVYESVVTGVKLFNDEKCRLIIAAGGGSAMDVAKCIKLFSNMNHSKSYLEQKIIPNSIILVAIPTTAGSGSEATRFAVIYHNGEKCSISSNSCIPSTVLIDPSVLNSLPEYQKKATMLDALCHSMESFWSINSNDESREFSKAAIELIMTNKERYLEGNETGNVNMLKAAFLAGKAINITQTTAGHAMCYKLTSLYGIAHGHAAALCVSRLFPYMINNLDKCIDPRGINYLHYMFDTLANIMGCVTAAEAVQKFNKMLADLSLNTPTPRKNDFETLKTSVNPERLKNNPIMLGIQTIDYLYHQILNIESNVEDM